MLPIHEAIGDAPHTIADLLDWPAEFYPTRAAVIAGPRSLTFEELRAQVIERAAEFADQGVRRFQRWLLIADHSADFFISLFALARVGAVAACVSPTEAVERAGHFITTARLSGWIGPRATFADRGDPASPVKSRARLGEFEVCFLANPSIVGDRLPPIDIDPALLIWSSGSAREPRGVILQHVAVLANIRSNVKALGLKESDRTLVVLCLAHAYALIHQCLCHLAIGATVCCPTPPVLAPTLDRHLEELSITTLVTVPPLLNMLADGLERSGRLCSALRLITVGGARANAKILARAMDLLPHVNFALTYGLTEAGPRVSTNFVKRGEADTTCVGTPLRNVEVRLANRENCAAEVCIRGSSLMRSYADAEWEEGLDYTLKTSDWGEMIDGKLHIRGRLDRAINRGGRLLVAEAIEDVLREHPAVKNVRVEGRQHSFWGEVPVAIVSIHKDKPQPTANDLRHFCAQRLSTSEMPVGFEIVDFCKGNVKEQKMLAMERLESFTSGRND